MPDPVAVFLKNVAVVCRGNSAKYGYATASNASVRALCLKCNVPARDETLDNALIRLRSERLIVSTNGGEWWLTKAGEERAKNGDVEKHDDD